jgi:hypothetical protein
MRTYVMTSESVFGLLVLAHAWRVAEEGTHLLRDPSYGSHHCWRRGSVLVGLARAQAQMTRRLFLATWLVALHLRFSLREAADEQSQR